MLVTVEEAKKKTCPYIRYCENERSVYHDGDKPVYAHSQCLADECMAWRWETTFVSSTPKIDAIKKYRQETGAMLKDAKDYVEAHPHLYDHSSERRGYCGLVGEP